MKNRKKVKSSINLEKLAGGAFAEKLNEALAQVAENIQNPNTDAATKRGITVNIKFAPNKTRQMVSTTIQVTTKLAATEAIDTQMVMGMNMRTGEIEIAEYDGQVRGQIALDDITESDEDPDEVQAPEAEQVQPQAQPTGKPLDLRNRGKKPEAEGPVLVPGRDYNPMTGEVLVDVEQLVNEQKPTTGKVVEISKKAAQA